MDLLVTHYEKIPLLGATLSRGDYHSENPNLVLHEGPLFHSMPVYQNEDPLSENYLIRIDKIIRTALSHHPRIAVFRFDPRLPQGMENAVENGHFMTAFWERLKDRIEHDRGMAYKTLTMMVHDTSVHDIWARQYDQSGRNPNWHRPVDLFRE